MKWTNLKGREFTEEENRWYNLSSGRFVKHQPKSDRIEWGIRNVRVIGTENQIRKFWELNGYMDEPDLFKPFEDIEFISLDASRRSEQCRISGGSLICPNPDQNDVESLTDDQIAHLTKFGFGGLFLKVRVIDVIDGDTLSVVGFFPLGELGAIRLFGKNNKVGIYPVGNHTDGFFAQFHIRVYGYDAVEKNEPNGKLAKSLLTDKLKSLNNIIWCQIIEQSLNTDKYDRILAVLYEDSEKKKLINNFLSKKETELGKHLVNPYLGRTKKSFKKPAKSSSKRGAKRASRKR